ncbi:redox-sensing transcriptional repressor Rex [Zongyangia hominis]|uniref:Redox-sensing transcriptional repressor Rex n=1 Tax=Zongyangia hominis TaxID=2763677 RepID=A0A926EEH2_9FIRM|nr:redox-sensing transcriptional repressor Rex [Zongyangia hominis]MBC8570964.1 redox-sensing transcriptional repressor Rex [Zongyangia hominis]
MAKHENVSLSVIRRLPRYYRFLGDLLKNGIHRISSRELSLKMGVTASQIRQDLNCFGGFGQQGYGYNVEALHKEIGSILGIDKGLDIILLGAGNLGRAIASHMSFDSRGFNLIGIFDVSEDIIGQTIRGIRVSHADTLPEFCRQRRPKVAMLCIPKNSAQEIADNLVELGIRGFWNFSHYDLALDYDNIVVENVHLGDSLMTLCYRVNEVLEQNPEGPQEKE